MPESQFDFTSTNIVPADLVIHPTRDAALARGPIGPLALGQAEPYAYYRGAGNVVAPTKFTPATTPRVINTALEARRELAESVAKDPRKLATGMLTRAFVCPLVRAAGGGLRISKEALRNLRNKAAGSPRESRPASGRLLRCLNHNVALLNDAKVIAWGDNSRNQVDPGGTDIIAIPADGVGVSGAAAVATGFFHSLALTLTGSVKTWGDNSYAQLGDGTTAQPEGTIARSVPLLAGITTVAANGFHNLALMSNGQVWPWGANTFGQLGDGTTINRSLPVQVQDLPGDVTALAAGMDYSVALLADGTVLTWGGNTNGQLGDGTTNRRLPRSRSRTPILPSSSWAASAAWRRGPAMCSPLSERSQLSASISWRSR